MEDTTDAARGVVPPLDADDDGKETGDARLSLSALLSPAGHAPPPPAAPQAMRSPLSVAHASSGARYATDSDAPQGPEVLTWHGSGRREDINCPRDVAFYQSYASSGRSGVRKNATQRRGNAAASFGRQQNGVSVFCSDTENSRILQIWDIPRHGGTALDAEEGDNVDGRMCRVVGTDMQLLNPTGISVIGLTSLSGSHHMGCVVLVCDGFNR